MKVQTLKGFRDFLPREALKRKWLRDKITEVFELWGYDPIETPTLEPLELFAGQIGEDEKLFFKFKDQGGRDVALRYDQTVPACRVVGQYNNQIPFPFKRYQIQPAFRAENPQKGRYREFLQCDADIFGIDSPHADAEIIGLSLDIYKRLGFTKATVLVNDRALLKDIPYEAIVAIDKLKKIGKDGVYADMEKRGIERSLAEKYLEQVLSLQPNETIRVILDYLKDLGFENDWYAFDPTIARSFSYSTGPIWEVIIPGFDAGSVLGGERFDKLIGKVSGVEIPGTGFGLGFDRTLLAAEQFGLIPKLQTKSKVLVTIFNPELKKNSLEISSRLRSKNINCELYLDENARLEKQLKYADQKGIPFVVAIGPEEVKNNTVVVRNMKTREQKIIAIEKLSEELL